MIGLHSQSVPAEVYNKVKSNSKSSISQKYKGVIFPPCDYIVSPCDYIVFSNVNDNSSKIWITNEQLCHYCIMLDVYGPLCLK